MSTTSKIRHRNTPPDQVEALRPRPQTWEERFEELTPEQQRGHAEAQQANAERRASFEAKPKKGEKKSDKEPEKGDKKSK